MGEERELHCMACIDSSDHLYAYLYKKLGKFGKLDKRYTDCSMAGSGLRQMWKIAWKGPSRAPALIRDCAATM